MKLPFLSELPRVELRDPLAETLGVLAPGETFRYGYEDAVKLCGHSCPTVAGAFLGTVEALRRLYPGETPIRGEIEVVVGGEPSDGSSGPMAQVIGLLTGAAPDTGFGGLLGRWKRMHLLSFDPSLAGTVRFRRRDTGAGVEIAYDPAGVPPAPDLARLMTETLSGRASPAVRERFAALWQDRVRDLLTGDLSRVLRIRDLPPQG